MSFYHLSNVRRLKSICRVLSIAKLPVIFLMVFVLNAAAETIPGAKENKYSPARAAFPVAGKVVDEKGEPLPGVLVKEKGAGNPTSTTGKGTYAINVTSGEAILVFSFIGFETKEVPVKGQSTLDVWLIPSSNDLGEVVVVGYGQQKRVTVTGSVASLSGAEMVTTKTQNLQNTLTGKIPGLRVVQRTSEPGTFDNRFDIRGFGNALIVVDGVPRGNLERIDPNDVESISVLKDAAAAIYGVRAANGVVLVTTKKGAQGKARIEYAYMTGLQNPSGLPKPLNAVDRAVIFNEQSMHSLTNPLISVPDDFIQPYIDGSREDIDWYDRVMRNNAPQSQQNLSASGGSEKMDYFLNLGISSQGGFWRTDDLKYNKYNFRSNLNAVLSDRIKASLKVSGIVDQQDRPYRDSWEIFKNIWRARPDDFFYANDNPAYLYKNQSDFHPAAISNSDISGYRIANNKIFQSSFSLDYSVPGITGLTARGMFSYDANLGDRTDYQRTFQEYEYNAITKIYTPVNYQVPNSLTRNYGNTQSQLAQLSLNYNRVFGKHSLDALAMVEQTSSTGDGFFAQRQLSISLPYLFAGNATNQVGNANASGIYELVNKSLFSRVDYSYSSKYLLNIGFRYDGSSKFPSTKQWGLFPWIQTGWRLSEENFIKNTAALSFVSNLKLRASYGVMGDDGASSFQFITGYDYPFSGANSQGLASGYLFDGWTTAVGFRSVANPNITWYTAKTTNLGVDAEFWKGKLGLIFDAFRRDRSGLLANRQLSLPLSFGSNLPQENLNSDRTEGMELALTHKSMVGSDLGINISGNVALTRTKNRYVERAQDGSSYAQWRNSTAERYNDVWFGWGYQGQFQSYEQIRNFPVLNPTGRGTLPGDYIYQDWNEDGIIDDMDRYPIATSTNPSSDFNGRRNYPLLNFGLTLGVNYKSFDLNALFQGGAKAYASYGEMYSSLTSNALDFFMDRWHPQDPKKDPYDPSNVWIPGKQAYTGTTWDQNSERGIQNTSYLRLKTIELGYTFPSKLMQRIGVGSLRIYANGYNLVTFSNVLGVDPEHPSDIYGYMYPMNKTVNFGASLRL